MISSSCCEGRRGADGGVRRANSTHGNRYTRRLHRANSAHKELSRTYRFIISSQHQISRYISDASPTPIAKLKMLTSHTSHTEAEPAAVPAAPTARRDSRMLGNSHVQNLPHHLQSPALCRESSTSRTTTLKVCISNISCSILVPVTVVPPQIRHQPLPSRRKIVARQCGSHPAATPSSHNSRPSTIHHPF